MEDVWLPNGFFGYSYPAINTQLNNKLRRVVSITLPVDIPVVAGNVISTLGSMSIYPNITSQNISGLNNQSKLLLMFGSLTTGTNIVQNDLGFNIGFATSPTNRFSHYMMGLDNTIYSYPSIGSTITGVVKHNEYNTSANRFDRTYLAINPTGFNNDSVSFNVVNTGLYPRNINFLSFGDSGVQAFTTGLSINSSLKLFKVKHNLSGLPGLVFISMNNLVNGGESSFTNRIQYTFGIVNHTRDQFSIGMRARNDTITPNVSNVAVNDLCAYFNNNISITNITNSGLVYADNEYIYLHIYGNPGTLYMNIAAIYGVTANIGSYNLNLNNNSEIVCKNKPEGVLLVSTPNSYYNKNIAMDDMILNMTASDRLNTFSCGMIQPNNLSTARSYSYQYNSFVEFNKLGTNSFSGNISFNNNSVFLNSSYIESGYGQGFYCAYQKPSVIPYINNVYVESFENGSGDFQPTGNNYWVIDSGSPSTGTYSLRINCGVIPRFENAGVVLTKNLNNRGLLYFDAKAASYNTPTSVIRFSVIVNNNEIIQPSRSSNPLLENSYVTYTIPLDSGVNTIFFNHNQADTLPNYEAGFIYLDNIQVKEIVE